MSILGHLTLRRRWLVVMGLQDMVAMKRWAGVAMMAAASGWPLVLLMAPVMLMGRRAADLL